MLVLDYVWDFQQTLIFRFVPTRLVLDEFGIKDREEAKRHAAREVYKGRGIRFLKFEEVGAAMMHSLKKDINGACYFIFPDIPIIEVPDTGVIHMTILVMVGKVVAALGKTYLRVFARKKDGAPYRRCRRPGSDFDETWTRGAPGPKTKFGDPRLAHSARAAGPGAAKTAIFLLSKIRFFGHIFFISNRSDMFAMGFW